MESQSLSFQLTAFANIDVETAKVFVRSFDDTYNKRGISQTEIKGTPLFRIDSASGNEVINISLDRIDFFYSNYDMSLIDDVLKNLSKFNDLRVLAINRLAINFREIYLDKNFVLVEKLNKLFKFVDFFGNSKELMFRLNNVQTYLQTPINVITTLQSGLMTNTYTFEDANGIIVHYDINNKPAQKIEFDSVELYYKELYRLLINQHSKIAELLSDE